MKISYLHPPRAQTNLNPKTQKSILRDPQLSSKARFCPPGSGLSPFSKQKKKVSLKQLPHILLELIKKMCLKMVTSTLIQVISFNDYRSTTSPSKPSLPLPTSTSPLPVAHKVRRCFYLKGKCYRMSTCFRSGTKGLEDISSD